MDVINYLEFCIISLCSWYYS